jgi:hypothetical protein
MYDYEPDLWVKMIESTISKHAKHLEALDFWVDTLELYDREGNVYSQIVPKLAVNFK